MATHPFSGVPLDIALLAPLVAPIRQPYLGGAQALLRDLAVGLAARGHRVTLYATQGSDPAALPGVSLDEIEVNPLLVRPADFSPSDASPGDDTGERAAVEQAFQRVFDRVATRAPQHDLLHAHAYDEPAFRLAQSLPLPVAHTLHMAALDPTINAALGRLAPPDLPRANGQPWLFTVSRQCAASYRAVCRMDAVIYNGIDLAAIPFGRIAAPDGHLLFAGRIAPEKGAEDAIQIALAARRSLILAGGVYDTHYYESRVAPLLAAYPDQLTYLGPQSRERLWELMARAAAVLVPSRWDEPFGLVACEAQAAGAPVIAYDRGGLREVIADGQTGALVPSGQIDDAAAALGHLDRYDRRACRARIEAHFSLAATITAHEERYRWMLARASVDR